MFHELSGESSEDWRLNSQYQQTTLENPALLRHSGNASTAMLACFLLHGIVCTCKGSVSFARARVRYRLHVQGFGIVCTCKGSVSFARGAQIQEYVDMRNILPYYNT